MAYYCLVNGFKHTQNTKAMFNEIIKVLEEYKVSYSIRKCPLLDFDSLLTSKWEINVLLQNGKPWFFADTFDGASDMTPTDDGVRLAKRIAALH